jgi:glycosyltransferase involved in cell wall biosynthesis
LKVGVFLVDVLPASGGGFSYYERLIRAIDEHHFDSRIDICFVGRKKQPGKLNKTFYKISSYRFYRFFYILHKLSILNFISRVFSSDINVCSGRDRKFLHKYGIDILLYPQQNLSEVDSFPFISMNWDIGHKSTFAFPELIYNRNFEHREKWYSETLQKALAVFVESAGGKEELSKYFLIPEIKISIVPIFPGRVVEIAVETSVQNQILSKLGLTVQNYFYYPAQFWAHKNHFNLVVAFRQLMLKNPSLDLKLVFTGSDKGNKAYIQKVVQESQLEKSVLMLDFLSLEEVYTLYKNSVALVMPTFLGPTNMPLLEAQALQVPVICSNFSGHREICLDSAIYIEPANVESIQDAMQTLLEKGNRDILKAKSKVVFDQSRFKIQHSIHDLEQALIGIKPVRKTFA